MKRAEGKKSEVKKKKEKEGKYQSKNRLNMHKIGYVLTISGRLST